MKETSDGRGEYTRVVQERITTLDDLVRVCEIDLEYWDIDHWICNKWEVGAVDGFKRLKVEPLFQVKVWLIKRVHEIKARRTFDSLIEQARTFAPKYPKIAYPKLQDGLMYEIALPDMQLGRMVMASTTRESSDLTPESMVSRAERMVDTLMGMVSHYPIEQVLFPVGNDFFDSDNLQMETTHGTPQQDDPRWQMVFDMGVTFVRTTIDKLAPVAPVKVLVIPGNHDETKSYYMGRELAAWYHSCPNVTVDNSECLRKYHKFGKNLIGLTHGYHEKFGKLDSLMAYEQPQMWAESVHREWHLGDRHHKADMLLKTDELDNGVVVRILRSLAPPSVWEYNKAYVGALKAAEGFLWHKDRGVIAQFTATE